MSFMLGFLVAIEFIGFLFEGFFCPFVYGVQICTCLLQKAEARGWFPTYTSPVQHVFLVGTTNVQRSGSDTRSITMRYFG